MRIAVCIFASVVVDGPVSARANAAIGRLFVSHDARRTIYVLTDRGLQGRQRMYAKASPSWTLRREDRAYCRRIVRTCSAPARARSLLVLCRLRISFLYERVGWWTAR